MNFYRSFKHILQQKIPCTPILNNEVNVGPCSFQTLAQSLIYNLYDKKPKFEVPSPSPDLAYLLSKIHRAKIIENLSNRLEVTQEEASNRLQELYYAKEVVKNDPTELNRNKLSEIASKFPNLTHPDAAKLIAPNVIKHKTWKPTSPLKVNQPFEKLGANTGGLRTHDTSQVASERSYYLFGQLAELEQALIR